MISLPTLLLLECRLLYIININNENIINIKAFLISTLHQKSDENRNDAITSKIMTKKIYSRSVSLILYIQYSKI